MTKRKLIIIIVIVLILAALLIPIPNRYKDGGTVEYKALLYSYTKYHAMSINKNENGEYEEGFDVGTEIKFLWFSIYKDTHFEKSENSNILIDNSEPSSGMPNGESSNPTATPKPTPTQITKDLPLLPSGKTLSFDTLPIVDGAKALEPFYDAVFAELLGISTDDAKTLIWCNNTPDAYKNLTYGKADMIFCALPSAEQVAEADENDVEFDYHTILSGGFVFFVNKDNPVDSITQEELKGIVSGKITNWKELGGEDEPIALFQRNEGSGSQTGLYRYVLPKEEVMPPSLDKFESTMEGVVDRVSDYDNGRGAISYSYYYYVANMYTSDQIKLLGIDGIVPSDETISKGIYPFLNFSQIVTRKDLPKDSIVWDIIAYVQGDNGARIARENGYVPYLPSGGAEDNGSATVMFYSDESFDKNREFHTRLLAADDFSHLGTGKELSEAILSDQAYGIERNHPDNVEDIFVSDGVNVIHVKGLKDKEIENKINDRIDEVVGIILDPAYYPELSGIVPFLREHGPGKREIYMSTYYNQNHILSLDISVSYNWTKPIAAKWYDDIPDTNDDGRIDDDDIYWFTDYGVSFDTIQGIDAYSGGGLHSSAYEEMTYFNINWIYQEYKGLNFNLETGEELRLSDMFPEGYDYLELVNNEYFNQIVKSNYSFSDDYLDENGRERVSDYYKQYYEPNEYDGGSLFTGINPNFSFVIYSDKYISIYDKESNYCLIEIEIPPFNMVEFSDIFEESESKEVFCLEENSFYTWYNARFDPIHYDSVGTFVIDINDADAISINVVVPKEFEAEIYRFLPKKSMVSLAKSALERSKIRFFDNDICSMYPSSIDVLPNGYVDVKWCVEIWNDEEERFWSTYIDFDQWVKDGKDVPPSELIDVSTKDMIKMLLLKIKNWSYEITDTRLDEKDAERAAEILSKHFVSWNAENNFAPIFDFLYEGSESYPDDNYSDEDIRTCILSETERAELPKEVFECVKANWSWDYDNWDIDYMNDYYKHFKIYDGYEF